MNTIKTKSFELAVYARGDESSPKLAVVIPGRLDTKDYVHCISHVDYLSSKGYFALSFDVPGTWNSPGDIKEYSTTTYLKCLYELIEHFGNKPTLLVGHSRGGTVTMLASSNKAVEGIVAIMATYGDPEPPDPKKLKAEYEVSYRDLPPGKVRTKEQKEFHLPTNYFVDSAKYDPVAVLRQLTKPKLLVYGDQDSFTEQSEVEEVYKNIPEPKMKKLVHSPHDYRLLPDVLEEINQTIGIFLGRYE